MHWLVLIGVLFVVFVLTFTIIDLFIKKSNNPGNKWDQTRCNVDVMFTAFKYKPREDPRSGLEFMQDNFSFCISSIIESVFKRAMTPFVQILGANVGINGAFNGILGTIRGLIVFVQTKFSKIIDATFNRFKTTIYNFVHVWHRLNFSFQRGVAVALSSVYAGISFFVGFMNFYDFVAKVVIIILGILIALIFLLFFILIPVMPVIFTVLAVLTGAGFGAALGGMESTFCVDPDANVKMADGTFKPLKYCVVGDVLAKSDIDAHQMVSDNIIEGILTCDGMTEDCVRIRGVTMSKSHRVLYDGHYILAGLHPEAVVMEGRLPQLICLNTTTHEVPMQGLGSDIVWVGDWEEVDDDAGRSAWFTMVYSYLNFGFDDECRFMNTPTTVPLMSPYTIVKEKTKGYIPIQEITIGDVIADMNGAWTPVLACYVGGFHGDSRGETFWYSDGVWIQGSDNGEWNTCAHGSVAYDSAVTTKLRGCNIVTASGSYLIRHQGVNVIVRDFTEMGIDMVKNSYEVLDAYIG